MPPWVWSRSMAANCCRADAGSGHRRQQKVAYLRTVAPAAHSPIGLRFHVSITDSRAALRGRSRSPNGRGRRRGRKIGRIGHEEQRGSARSWRWTLFELVGGLNDALADERIGVEERPGRHKVRYAVFRTDAERLDTLGNLPADRAVSLLGRMKYESDFVLELGATVVFLRDEWHYFGKDKVAAADATGAAVEETKRRKTLKATPERLEKALALLRDLGLAEAPVPAGGR